MSYFKRLGNKKGRCKTVLSDLEWGNVKLFDGGFAAGNY